MRAAVADDRPESCSDSRSQREARMEDSEAAHESGLERYEVSSVCVVQRGREGEDGRTGGCGAGREGREHGEKKVSEAREVRMEGSKAADGKIRAGKGQRHRGQLGGVGGVGRGSNDRCLRYHCTQGPTQCHGT